MSRFAKLRRTPKCKFHLESLEQRVLLSVCPVFDLAITAEDPDVAALTQSPFPSNRFTVADDTQNTGLRVDLPLPDPAMQLSNYQDTLVISTLDGFNLQPRLSIPFSGPIDVASVNSQNIFLISLGDTLPGGNPGGQVVGINQIVWDPPTNTLHVESDQLLDQHTRYALIVTDGLLDATGQPVQPSDNFNNFRHDLNFGQSKDPVLKAYRKDLLDALAAARHVGVPESDIVVASVFTTQSATAILEKIRDQIHAGLPQAPAMADFNLGPGGSRTVFNLNQVVSITHNQQRTTSPSLTAVPIPLASLKNVIPGAVSQVAFGKYISPDYEVPGEYIPAAGTRTDTPGPAVQGYNDIYFTLCVPSGPEPEGGWPVVIWGHGGAGSKENPLSGVPAVAATMAANGIATIGITVVGHGYGPSSTLTVAQNDGSQVAFLSGGRSIDQNGDNNIGAAEGFLAASPQAIISERDGRIQTVADLMQLVRVIQAGMDVDSDGFGDLDPSRVYYAGVSLGGNYGGPFLAVEPGVSAGVLNVPGGSAVERLRLGAMRAGVSPIGVTAAGILASRTPPLINPNPGDRITILDGLTVSPLQPYFNENMPLRDGVPLTVKCADGSTRVIQSPVTNDVAGAMAIQAVFDNYEWVSQPGDPVAYAPHLCKDPLPGVPVKPVIIQFAKGDQMDSNPTATALLRAGDLADRATYYRYDLAFPKPDPNSPPVTYYPHTFAVLVTSANPTIKKVALAAQNQIATFFASETGETIQPQPPNGAGVGLIPEEYFEGVNLPIEGGLPEGLNFTVVAAASPQASTSLPFGSIPIGAASDELEGDRLDSSPAAIFESTAAALSVPQAALAALAGPSASPASPLTDAPLDWLKSDLAGFLHPARLRR